MRDQSRLMILRNVSAIALSMLILGAAALVPAMGQVTYYDSAYCEPTGNGIPASCITQAQSDGDPNTYPYYCSRPSEETMCDESDGAPSCLQVDGSTCGVEVDIYTDEVIYGSLNGIEYPLSCGTVNLCNT